MKRIRTAVVSPAFVAGFVPAIFVWALTAIGAAVYYL